MRRAAFFGVCVCIYMYVSLCVPRGRSAMLAAGVGGRKGKNDNDAVQVSLVTAVNASVVSYDAIELENRVFTCSCVCVCVCGLFGVNVNICLWFFFFSVSYRRMLLQRAR